MNFWIVHTVKHATSEEIFYWNNNLPKNINLLNVLFQYVSVFVDTVIIIIIVVGIIFTAVITATLLILILLFQRSSWAFISCLTIPKY